MPSEKTVVRIREHSLHMGDDEMAEWSVIDPVGREWVRDFILKSVPAGKLCFQADVWNTEAIHNEVEINGHRIGHLPKNQSSSGVTTMPPMFAHAAV